MLGCVVFDGQRFAASEGDAALAAAGTALDTLPADDARAFVWVYVDRPQFDAQQAELQALFERACGEALLELHVRDLLNAQHPSRFDSTSAYDLLLIRRLLTGAEAPANIGDGASETVAAAAAAPAPSAAAAKRARRAPLAPALAAIDTVPVGLALGDRLLLSVHPPGCASALQMLQRLQQAGAANGAAAASPQPPAKPARALAQQRLPQSSADLMLRLVNAMVDGYLELRRPLAQQLDYWQQQLLDAGSRFDDWSALLDARRALHQVEALCEEQHDAMQEWLDTLLAQGLPDDARARHLHELLVARSRDITGHIERVLQHVRRLEHNAETAVQMHFSASANRANNVMRVLTALTAVFLPLNLITGIFGMNFEPMPLLKTDYGFWVTIATMATIALTVVLIFRRKRYLRTRG
jgi:hypothetical protein